MRSLTNALLSVPAIGRRVDRCRGWLSYVGTFGDDFFGDDDLFEDEEVTADAFA
jgi:hypothetical protein